MGRRPRVSRGSGHFVMNTLPLGALDVPTEAVLVFGALFVTVLLVAWFTRSRRRRPRRQPYQSDVDDFARIYRP